MSEQKVDCEPTEWHREYLEGREIATAKGEDSFICLDEFEEDLLTELNSRSSRL